MRRIPITGNLSRGKQNPVPPMRARVPIVKNTPTVTPKGSGNMISRVGATAKRVAGKTTQVSKPSVRKGF